MRSALRRRLDALERTRGDLELTPEEKAALASDTPCWPTANIAMAKMCARYGLERLILGSYRLERAP